jgi:hypothetical protein
MKFVQSCWWGIPNWGDLATNPPYISTLMSRGVISSVKLVSWRIVCLGRTKHSEEGEVYHFTSNENWSLPVANVTPTTVQANDLCTVSAISTLSWYDISEDLSPGSTCIKISFEIVKGRWCPRSGDNDNGQLSMKTNTSHTNPTIILYRLPIPSAQVTTTV